jgi:hypothetical protein
VVLLLIKTIRDFYRGIAPSSMIDEAEHALDHTLTAGDLVFVTMRESAL